ncbi:MAG: hypothetical protein KGR47_13775 [Acidobacteria bacterium]|nr:hypothetical protein [Acidobacteriota bacterium]
MPALFEGLLVDDHDDFGFADRATVAGDQVHECVGAEPVDRVERIGRTLRRPRQREPGLELFVEQMLEAGTDLGVERQIRSHHPRVGVDPHPAAAVAFLSFQPSFAVVGFDESDLALQPAPELFHRRPLHNGAGDEVGFQRAQRRLQARFEGTDRRGERVEMLTRQAALIHFGFHLGRERCLFGALESTSRTPSRTAGRPRVDRSRIHPGTLSRKLAEPLVQIDLTCLQEPLQPGDVGQQHRHRHLVQHRSIRIGDATEAIQRGHACDTPSRY